MGIYDALRVNIKLRKTRNQAKKAVSMSTVGIGYERERREIVYSIYYNLVTKID